MIRKLLAAMFFVLAAVCTSASAQSLLVVSRANDELVMMDPETGNVTARYATGSFPHEVAYDESTARVFAAAYAGDAVTMLDLKTGRLETWSISGSSPHGVAARAGRIWVTSEETSEILELDPDTGVVIDRWDTGGWRSHMLAVSWNSDHLYVANIDSGSVSFINTRTDETNVVTTGAGAEGIDISPDGAEVWVSNRSENTVSIIDTALGNVTHELDTDGEFPVKLRFRPDGEEVWIANNSSGTLIVIDAETRETRAIIETGPRPLGLAFSADSKWAYCSMPSSNEVLVIDTATYRIMRRLSAPLSPDGMVWLPF